MPEKLVAIAPFLHSCPSVLTLGVRASMGDYSPHQRRMLLSAGRILFPTPRFVRILRAAGKETFPSALAYSVRKSRLVQEALFQFLGCPHPVTRIYYGRQKSSIARDFLYPFLATGPNMEDRARMVCNACDLDEVSRTYNPLIIQEMCDYEERFRLVFINYRCVGIIERTTCKAQRGTLLMPHWHRGIAPESFSREIVACLEGLLESVQVNDIAAEIGITHRGWLLIELLRPPLSWPTHEGTAGRYRFISHLIESCRF